MKRNNKKGIYTICSISIVLALGLSACSSTKKEVYKNNSETTKQADIKENSNNNLQDNKKEVNTTSAQSNDIPKFSKKQLTQNEKPSFGTPWKYSENKSTSACIEGKGKAAKEEGIGKVYVKENNNLYSFEMLDNQKISPIYIDWADNKNLFVIVGSAFGTVSKGGNLYLLNIDTGKVSLIFDSSDKKQEIMTLQKVGGNLKLKVNVYEDDNFMKSHVEDWNITSFDVSLSKELEIKNSDGKVVYQVNKSN